ncbi:MAG TPA: c-type cytochrome [Terracidiphilus sp.]|nr:c-type cytochrome [Terracidiphilus sp.]
MKLSSPSFSAPLTALVFALFAVAALSQTPAAQQAPAEEHHHHEEPAPTNLKVLPKTMTGEQVHELMHKWEASLGAECSTCHAADPKNIGPNGKPRLNFADDSKPEKATARLMYRMVDDINGNYVEKVENSGVGVSCGTCHRGHLDPPIFTPPKEDHDHDHGAPPAPSAKPSSR